MASSDFTSISDLPGSNDTTKTNKVVLEKTEINNEVSSSSSPMPISPTELSSDSINKIVMGLQQASSTGMTQLPSSHIPMQPQIITQDPQVKPNYVPPGPTEDYIKQHDTIDSLMNESKKTQKEQDKLDVLYNELQMPIIVMTLFFIFQMPFFQKKFQSLFPTLFLKDVHHNILGYMVKTSLFGIIFYGLNKATNYLSEV